MFMKEKEEKVTIKREAKALSTQLIQRQPPMKK